jgi:hypothetical protein
MLTPRMGQNPPPGMPWAADTGCFASPSKYSDEKYICWLTKMLPVADRCLFATAPDVVADPVATLELSRPMFAVIRALGYRAALVAQDGLEDMDVPWGEFDALFVGGTTNWKLGPGPVTLVDEARRRGLWCHMGRVNSLRRMRYAQSIGCQSTDGTCLKYDPLMTSHNPFEWVEIVSREPAIWR